MTYLIFILRSFKWNSLTSSVPIAAFFIQKELTFNLFFLTCAVKA